MNWNPTFLDLLIYVPIAWMAFRALVAAFELAHLDREWTRSEREIESVITRRLVRARTEHDLTAIRDSAGSVKHSNHPIARLVARGLGDRDRTATPGVAEVWVEEELAQHLAAPARALLSSIQRLPNLGFGGTVVGLLVTMFEFSNQGDQRAAYAGIGIALSSTLAAILVAQVFRGRAAARLPGLVATVKCRTRENAYLMRAAVVRVKDLERHSPRPVGRNPRSCRQHDLVHLRAPDEKDPSAGSGG